MAGINPFGVRPPVANPFEAQQPAGLYGVGPPSGSLGSMDTFGNYTPTKKQYSFMDKVGMTWPAKLAQALIGGVTLPGDVYAGRVNPNSDEAVGRAADLAGMLALGGTAKAGLAPASGELGIFGGRLAKTAPLDELAKAQSLEQAGTSADDIWKATGWGKGADGQWRFEIPDDAARSKPLGWASGKDYEDGGQGVDPLGDVFEHPALGEAYPGTTQGFDASGKQVVVQTNPHMGENAAYYPEDGDIRVGGSKDVYTGEVAPNRGSLLHEIQHHVQETENFARGANVNDKTLDGYAQTLAQQVNAKYRPQLDALAKQGKWDEVAALDSERLAEVNRIFDLDKGGRLGYMRTAGEVESRNVQTRMDMTPAERRSTPPWATEDVPRDQQIVRMGR